MISNEAITETVALRKTSTLNILRWLSLTLIYTRMFSVSVHAVVNMNHACANDYIDM